MANKTRSSIPDYLPPISLGSDSEAVDWVNLCLVSIFTTPHMYEVLISKWLVSLSTYTKASDSEVKYEYNI